jgi:hypothetical protein
MLKRSTLSGPDLRRLVLKTWRGSSKNPRCKISWRRRSWGGSVPSTLRQWIFWHRQGKMNKWGTSNKKWWNNSRQQIDLISTTRHSASCPTVQARPLPNPSSRPFKLRLPGLLIRSKGLNPKIICGSRRQSWAARWLRRKLNRPFRSKWRKWKMWFYLTSFTTSPPSLNCSPPYPS